LFEVPSIETRDVDTVRRHVSFDAVHISLTNQVVAAYVRRTGIQIGPLRRNIAAAAIADPVVKRLVSPEALTELLAVGWPITALPPQQRFLLTFRLLQWRWQLVGVILPEHIQNLLTDELVKALRAPAQKP
jgi:Protein of unknown function (DUF2939)